MRRTRFKLFLLILGVVLGAVGIDWFILHRKLGPDMVWVSHSREYRLVCLQIYRQAAEKLEKISAHISHPWGIVMDLDDTCLSTIDYQRDRQLRCLPWFRPDWEKWCLRKRGVVIPGAVEFTEKVRELGGRVILLSDRREELREATEDNLRREGIVYDALLMKSGSFSNARWRELFETGPGIPGIGTVEVAMVIGDRISDFCDRGGDREHYGDWGGEFVIIPNPVAPTNERELE
ncbi:MAG: HAD family acid phosphatase [Candidatus Erginobacter occultus]|nr:HAD family acid phosphatase [Candidatus Erginobacter occultus]